VQRTIEGRLLSMSTNRKAIRPALQRRAAMNDRKGIDTTDYVGYGRPPKATQFAAGKRGNPKGRPKGSRTVGAILQDILSQKIAVTENGKTRRIPTLEAMFRRLVNDAIRRCGGPTCGATWRSSPVRKTRSAPLTGIYSQRRVRMRVEIRELT
jgi:hypothetical protein